MTKQVYRVGILATHPIQYYAPWYRALAEHPELDIEVFYCHNPAPQEQGRAGFGIAFEWDIPLLEGYKYQFLHNRASKPNVFTFDGCDTPKIANIIKRKKFDAFIVHGWYTKSYWQAIIGCWCVGTPVMVRGDSHLITPRSKLKKLAKQLFYRWFIPKFDAYLAVGELAQNYYLHYGATAKKIYFTPHAVNNIFFAQHRESLDSQRTQLRKNIGLPNDAIVYLFVGKIYLEKRLQNFLDAINLASQTNLNIFGVVAGDGTQRNELEEYAKLNNIAVKFLGFLNQTQLPLAYTISDVLVVPSESETWGLAVNEAMASGLPAIVSDQVGCAPDLVHPGSTGAIFPCGDIKKLSELLLAFAADKALLHTMSRNANKLIDRYSIASAVEGTVAALRYIKNI